jgi:hypothetical protein
MQLMFNLTIIYYSRNLNYLFGDNKKESLVARNKLTMSQIFYGSLTWKL